MKKLSTFLLKPLVRKSILSTLVVVGVFMVRIPVEVSANTCTQYLYPCPSTISVWGGNVLNYYGGIDSAALGTLPNGHPFCGYFAQYGDPFTGAYDRVLGRQITFVRSVTAGPITGYGGYDQFGNPDPTGCYDVNLNYTCSQSITINGGQYVDINPINQGTKCQGQTAPNDQGYNSWPGSKYWLEHDCSASGQSEASSWTSWYAYDPSANVAYSCRGGPATGGGVGCMVYNYGSMNSGGSGTQICVNVGFQ